MLKILGNPTAISYLVVIITGGYGFLLFWWWYEYCRWRDAHISSVYLYVMFLLGSLAVDRCFALYAMSLRLTDRTAFTEFINSSIWPIRLLPTIICVLAIIIHMSYRLFYLRKKDCDTELEDRRSTD